MCSFLSSSLLALLVFCEKCLLKTTFLALDIVVHSRRTDHKKKRAIYRDHIFNNLSDLKGKKKRGGNNLKARNALIQMDKANHRVEDIELGAFNIQPVRNTRFRG